MQRHLEEVRAAAALAEGHAVAQEDLSAVCGRTGELQQMVRWCKTSGREVRLPPVPCAMRSAVSMHACMRTSP